MDILELHFFGAEVDLVRVDVDENLEFVDERFVLIKKLGHLQLDRNAIETGRRWRGMSKGENPFSQIGWRIM